MSYSNFNTFKLFQNVGINSSSDYALSMESDGNNVSFHSSNSIDYNNVDIMSIKNIINKKQNEDLNLSSLNGTTINPVITINNNHSDCRIMTNLNVNGNVNINNNLIIPTHNNSNLLSNVQGSIYFNKTQNMYEGYVGNGEGWQPLGGFSKTKDATIHKNLNVIGNINLTNGGLIKTTGIGSFGSVNCGVGTFTSLDSGSGLIKTTGIGSFGSINCGVGTFTSLDANDGLIKTTGIGSFGSINCGVGTFTSINSSTAIADEYIASAATWNAKQSALTFGKSSGYTLKTEETLTTNDILLMGTNHVKGRTYEELKSDLSLNNVQNTSLSTWSGSGTINTVGTITSGTWNGSTIGTSHGGSPWSVSSNDIYVASGKYVGINTNDPGYALEVKKPGTTGTQPNLTESYGYMGEDGTTKEGGDWTGDEWKHVVARFHGYVEIDDYLLIFAGNHHECDSRIKTNIVDVPDNLALEQLRNIPCRYYEYIDKIKRGPNKTIGFIAQEVKEVLPMAIKTTKHIIPDVYKNIGCAWTSIDDKFNMSSTDLPNVSGVKYKFYVSNAGNYSDEKEIELTGNSDNTFTFDTQYTNVFCYGSEVDDFHTVDKDELFALNFSATQEIDRIQQTHITEIASLKTENEQQQNEINTLKTENIELKSIIDKLKTANSFEDFKNSL